MKKIVLLLVVILIAVTTTQLWMTQEATDQKNEIDKVDVAQQSQIGGAFTLTDHTGKTVSDTDFQGKAMLVFFGFTRCPDVCPVTMTAMTKAMELLGSKADQVQPLFISVDPEHDTPKVLADFVANFDKRIVAMTGTAEQVRQVADAYKAYYAKSAGEDESAEANVDHSTYMYLMGKDGQFIKVLPYNVPEEELAGAIASILN
jgi:protein SCO1/2